MSPKGSKRLSVMLSFAWRLDGVSGPATGVLAATLSPRGTLVSFAAMSLKPMSISPLDIIFKPVTVRGFFMGHPEFAAKLAPAAAQAAEMIASGQVHVPVAATYALSSIKEAVAHAQRGGKILLDVAGNDGGSNRMSQTIQVKNKALVLEAFDTLFNKRDYVAAERYWSPTYIQHSAAHRT